MIFTLIFLRAEFIWWLFYFGTPEACNGGDTVRQLFKKYTRFSQLSYIGTLFFTCITSKFINKIYTVDFLLFHKNGSRRLRNEKKSSYLWFIFTCFSKIKS